MAVMRTTPQLVALRGVSAKKAVATILGSSVGVLALLIAVIFGHGRADSTPEWVRALPALNAVLNATSALFLVLAGLAVRRRDFATHARRMLGALGTSALFLVSYVVYHSVHGDMKFAGLGAVRSLYFFILISHVALSAVVLPLIFSSFFFSLSGRFPQHTKISRYTFPLWLYVSVTGVLVYVLLHAYAA